MKPPPAFQFYPSDYLSSARVQAMSLEAEGAYIRLLCYNWMNGFIPDSIPLLARLCKISDRKMKILWDQISTCFEVVLGPGRLANKRLEDTRQKQLNYRNERSESGRKGAENKWKEYGSANGSANGSAMNQPMAKNGSSSSSSSSSSPLFPDSSSLQHSPPAEKRPVAYSNEFEKFWKAYPKKKGKGGAFKAWKKNGHPSVEQIIAVIERAKASQDWLKNNGQYIPKPATWLNDRSWDDEYVPVRTERKAVY